jgi:hypothetical protein
MPQSRFEFGSSSSQENRGFNNVWRASDQQRGNDPQQYNERGFGGVFGEFDEGYFDGNQGQGNNFTAINRNNYRYRRPYRQQFYGTPRVNRGGYRNGFADHRDGNRNFGNNQRDSRGTLVSQREQAEHSDLNVNGASGVGASQSAEMALSITDPSHDAAPSEAGDSGVKS